MDTAGLAFLLLISSTVYAETGKKLNVLLILGELRTIYLTNHFRHVTSLSRVILIYKCQT
jgi:hypothetical protein